MTQSLLKFFKPFLLLCSLFLVSGCGFHLKHNDGLVEKYPQYQKINLPSEFYFNYHDGNLNFKIINILNNYNENYSKFFNFTKNISYEDFSLKKFMSNIIELSKKKNL